jgi:hypothetical protein
MKEEYYYLSVKISGDLIVLLERMPKEIHKSPTNILKRAIFLMDVAIKSRKEGKKLAVLDSNEKKVSDIIWI